MGRLVPNDMMLACRAAQGPGSICTATVLFSFSSPLFPAKKKLKEEVSLELPSATNSLLQSVQTR